MMRFLRPRFQDLKPYHSTHITTGVILNANESPYTAPEALVEHMQKWMSTEMLSSRYPDTDSVKLAEAIAKAYDVKAHNCPAPKPRMGVGRWRKTSKLQLQYA